MTGGNPQIPKGDGPLPVAAYIAAMPGWKRALGERLDALIMAKAPAARKAVRWNMPFWGMEGQGWAVGFSCAARYVKVSFFNGASLEPIPPVASTIPNVRYLHILDDGFDEAQFRDWVRQAFALPGAPMF